MNNEIFFTVSGLLVFIVVLIYISGWFSASETALTHLSSLDAANLSKSKHKNVKCALALQENMDQTLVMILIANNLVNIVLSAVTAVVAEKLFHTIGVSIAVGLITFLIIMFADILPKSRAILQSTDIVLKRARILCMVRWVLKPVVWFLLFLTRKLLPMWGLSGEVKRQTITEEGILELVNAAQHEGSVRIMERDIIQRVFSFGDARCVDVMVPMDEVFTLRDSASLEKARQLIAQKGFTRVPIVNGDHKVVGLLYSKDLLQKKGDTVQKLMRKALFVNESDLITEVLTLMKSKRVHMMIVRNSRGKHLGIITLEDILEELVGEIQDEYYEMKR